MAENIATLVARLVADSSGFSAGLGSAQRDLANFTTRARGAGREASRAFDGVSSAWRAMAGTLAAVGVTVGIASTVREAAQFSQQIRVISVQARASAAETASLAASVRSLGVEYRIGAVAAATAAQELLKSGVDIDSVNSGALRSTIELARVLGDDYASAATIAATAMSVFGLDASDLDQVVQGIAGTVLAGRFELQDYALALQQGGRSAVDAGISLDDFNTLLLLFQRRIGGSGSDMGTLARTFLSRLVPASEEARKRMQELNLSFFNAQGEFVGLEEAARRAQAAFGNLSTEQQTLDFNLLAGADARRAYGVLVDEGAEGIRRFSAELRDQARVGDIAEARTKGLSGATAELAAQWQELSIAISESGLEDFLAGALGLVSDLVRGLTDAVNQINGIVPQADTGAGLQTLRDQLKHERELLERRQGNLEMRRIFDPDDKQSPRLLAEIAQREENIRRLSEAIGAVERNNGRPLPTVTLDYGGERPVVGPSRPPRRSADQIRDDFLRDRGASDATRAEQEYARALRETQGEYGRYLDAVTSLLQLRGQMPGMAESINSMIRGATSEFVQAEAAARGFREEYATAARDAPGLLRPLADALAQDLNTIGADPSRAAEGLLALRQEVERFMATLSDMHARVEAFSGFDALSASLQTDAERVSSKRAQQILQLESLRASGLFPDAEVEALRQRIQRSFDEAIGGTSGGAGAGQRFGRGLAGSIEEAFVNWNWDFGSIRDKIGAEWNQMLYDVFIGDDVTALFNEIGRGLHDLLAGMVRKMTGGQSAGAAIGSAIVQGVQSLFGGRKRHSGGPVNAGEPYIVGKTGAEELFVPDTSGHIYPGQMKGAAAGRTTNVHVTYDLRGANGDAQIAAIVARNNAMLRATILGEAARQAPAHLRSHEMLQG